MPLRLLARGKWGGILVRNYSQTNIYVYGVHHIRHSSSTKKWVVLYRNPSPNNLIKQKQYSRIIEPSVEAHDFTNYFCHLYTNTPQWMQVFVVPKIIKNVYLFSSRFLPFSSFFNFKTISVHWIRGIVFFQWQLETSYSFILLAQRKLFIKTFFELNALFNELLEILKLETVYRMHSQETNPSCFSPLFPPRIIFRCRIW